MQIHLIRHLPTKWNKEGRLQGGQDIPLAEVSYEFKRKIEQNINELKLIGDVNLTLTSTLSRTQQTASVYGYDQTQIEPLLDELSFGAFEGKPKEKLIQNPTWTENPRSLVLGESLIDFEKRIVSFLHKYKDTPSILAFAHGSWMRAAISIKHTGNINKMNQMKVKNNDLIQLEFTPLEVEELLNNTK